MRTAVLVLAAGVLAAGQGAPTEDDLVLLQPYLDRTPLGDGIEAYSLKGVVLVPLGELCRLLGFGITVDPARRSAAGFFITPKRTFHLDLDQGQVEVEGRRMALVGAVRMPRDIYVDVRSLAAWFPLDVVADLKGSGLNIKAKEKLPIQAGWEREAHFGNQSLARQADDGGTHGRPHPSPYAFLDVPSADLALNLGRAWGPPSDSASGSATLGGDLLWMSSDLFLSRDAYGSWNNSRATLFREDPAGGLVGPLHARQVEAGDLLTAPSLDLVGSLPQGRGLDIDNFPVAFRTRFATRTFRGGLSDGWSVEFYQNGSMVAFQHSRADALYEFKDIPLRFGINLFRLVFHGPLGELREETYRMDISQDQPPPGSFYYGVTWVRPNAQDLVTAESAGTGFQPAPGYLAQAEYGLSSAFSLQAGTEGIPLPDGHHDYGMVGMRGVWSFMTLQASAAQDRGPGPTPGKGLEAVLRTGSGYSTVTLRRDEFYDGFEQSVYGSTGLGATGYTVKDGTGLGVDTSWSVAKTPFSVSAQLDQEDYVGGAHGQRERLIFSTQAGLMNLVNSLTRLTLPGAFNPLQGLATVTSFRSDWSWQGNLTYDQHRLNGWGGQVQYQVQQGFQYHAGLLAPLGPVSTPDSTGPLQLFGGLLKVVGRYGLGMDLQKTGSSYSANVTFQLSLGREPRTGTWVTDAQSLATTGSVSAVAFLDSNGNGVRDPGEPILEGTRFRVGASGTQNQVGDSGVTFVTKLAAAQPVDVSLDESSLNDPGQKSAVKAWTILPRPGKVERLEFPVAVLGDVNGTVRIRRAGKREELPGLEMELVDAGGKRVKAMRTAYDGFFEFPDLPYGEYRLRVTPEELRRVGLQPSEPRLIRIEAGHNFIDGADLVVEPIMADAAQSPERIQP